MIGALKPRLALLAGSVGLVCLMAAQTWTYLEEVGIREEGTQSLLTTILVVVLIGTFLVTGGLLASVRPQHAIGWLLLAMGMAGVTVSIEAW